MSFDMTKRDDDEWLELALRQQPKIQDNGFAASVLARIEKNAKQRFHILALCILVDLGIAAFIIPWKTVLSWLSRTKELTPTVTLPANGIDGLTPLLNSSTTISIFLFVAMAILVFWSLRVE